MMFRVLPILAFLLAGALAAQPAETPARLIAQQSSAEAGWFGGGTLQLALSEGVPFRVFTLDEPARLVVDFKGLDASGFTPATLLSGNRLFSGARMGTFEPGWTRLVADLASPLVVDKVDMQLDRATGGARLSLSLAAASEAEFAAAAGPPPGVPWARIEAPAYPATDPADFVVVLDPGHGGVDPGAERDGVSEKTLMLEMARRLAEVLHAQEGVRVILTRSADVFVSLDARVALAQSVHADLFLSLHADALSEGGAEGATFYTLSEEASDTATAQLAARHNRADLLAGADLSSSEDSVTRVLLDIARRETDPRSRAFAQTLVAAFEAAQVPVNHVPLRQAGFSVLKSADIPSVLVEVGFLSSPRDLANLKDQKWRARAIEGLASAVRTWRQADLQQAAGALR